MTDNSPGETPAFSLLRQEPAQVSLTKLRALLMHHGIPVHGWGLEEAKSVEDLYGEIATGETTLVVREGRLLRKVGAVTMLITHRDPSGVVYTLVEDRQEFIDGRVRRRKLPCSISEKLKSAEPTLAAAERALAEELGIGGGANPKFLGTEEKELESPSYPGLRTAYVFHNFSLELSTEHFRPDGYIERAPDKTSYFVWRKG